MNTCDDPEKMTKIQEFNEAIEMECKNQYELKKMHIKCLKNHSYNRCHDYEFLFNISVSEANFLRKRRSVYLENK